MVEIAGHKRAVARPQLGDGDALASGPAESLVELHTGVVRWVAECASPGLQAWNSSCPILQIVVTSFTSLQLNGR